MSTLRNRTLALVATGAASAVLAGFSATPAAATIDSGRYKVTISLNYVVTDDDGDGVSNPTVSGSYKRDVNVGPFYPVDWEPLGKTACAGGEVWAQLQERVAIYDSRNPDGAHRPNQVRVDLGTVLYEGASCSTGDSDGYGYRTFYVDAGTDTYGTFNVYNTEEGSSDKIKVAYRITNSKVG
ncbi:hypothetical protein OG985_49330 (plasmid) [Streptomyces sp. NBC_00289]|uniref:hypothetical protein n=1 Tax=Streptomyces sp. NBC_00289 TaxID=2975703 RepID=UPI002F91737A